MSVREIRIYQPGDYQVGQLLELSPQASQHVGVVLRMQECESLTLFCGDNREFDAVIDIVKKKQVFVTIKRVKNVSCESPIHIHLAQGISKGDRMEMVMQKAVELGVNSITPIITQRCAVKLDNERSLKKIQQWQAIAVSACEQSGRNMVPVINPPLALDDFLAHSYGDLKLILDPLGAKNWRDYRLELKKDIALLIGPEGGFTNEEVLRACAKGFESLSLGPRILRTETAAITAISLVQAVAGDL